MYNVCIYADRVKVNINFDIVISVLAENQDDVPEPEKQKLKAANRRLRTKVCCLAKKTSRQRKLWMTKDEAVTAISQFVSGTALELLKTQIMLAGRKRQGHRYSEEYKMFAMSLYHASPKCYKLLKKTLALPGISILKSYLKKVDIKPGFHQNIFDALTYKAEHMSAELKFCAILFDEMAIKEQVSYDIRNDNVCGLEYFGTGGRTRYVANHAGGFMVRGLVDKWKQPVGYFLTSGPMCSDRLTSTLLTCIEKVRATGLIVKAVICDQSINNRYVVNSLGVSVDCPTFQHNGPTILCYIYPPHLLKNIRNNMKRSGFRVNEELVSWKYVQQFYGNDSILPIRMAPQLTA